MAGEIFTTFGADQGRLPGVLLGNLPEVLIFGFGLLFYRDICIYWLGSYLVRIRFGGGSEWLTTI